MLDNEEEDGGAKSWKSGMRKEMMSSHKFRSRCVTHATGWMIWTEIRSWHARRDFGQLACLPGLLRGVIFDGGKNGGEEGGEGLLMNENLCSRPHERC
jgi:hypothetical protein